MKRTWVVNGISLREDAGKQLHITLYDGNPKLYSLRNVTLVHDDELDKLTVDCTVHTCDGVWGEWRDTLEYKTQAYAEAIADKYEMKDGDVYEFQKTYFFGLIKGAKVWRIKPDWYYQKKGQAKHTEFFLKDTLVIEDKRTNNEPNS